MDDLHRFNPIGDIPVQIYGSTVSTVSVDFLRTKPLGDGRCWVKRGKVWHLEDYR